MAFFSIPGNIKQRFLPFVLDPSAWINFFNDTTKSFNATAELASPQLFTYKRDQESNGGTARLGFYPMTSFPGASEQDYDNVNMSKLDDDISFKLLYESKDGSTKSLTVDDLVSNLPGISIREFLPDTRLDQCVNFFKDLFSQMAGLFNKAKDVGKGQPEAEKQTALMKAIWECTKFTIAYMSGIGEQSFLTDVFKDTSKAFRAGEMEFEDYNTFVQYVHDFPFVLYYRLQSCTTTNIYQVPAMCEGKPIMSSDGKAGWGDGSDLMGAGGFRVSGLLNKIPLVGQIAETLLGNIGVNYMPWWNAESGSKVAAPEVNVTFDLFNDNIVKAVKNFIFVNTIVPNNRWIQYNMFQHSSNLYDVKIDGVNRLFACAGAFDVKYEGVLRNPPPRFTELLKPHINKKMFNPDNFIEFITDNNIIKIPDVYRVNMSFKSLLPANFNNYLFTYSQNVNHMVQYAENVRDATFGSEIGNGIATFAGRIKKVFDKGDWKVGFDNGADKIETENDSYKS